MRVPPRRLAPVLFGCFNILVGLAKMADPTTKSYGLTKVPGSLTLWGLAFVVLGLLIISGITHPRLAWVSMAASVFLWWMWADFVHEARMIYPAYVTVSGWVTPFAIGGLHAVLAPYYRDYTRDLPA